MSPDFSIKQPSQEMESLKTRLTLLMLGVMGISAAVVIRAAYIQVPGNPRLEAMARRQFQSHALVRPRRGSILDRNGEPLAINKETNSLAANPTKVRNKRALARVLGRAVDIPFSRLFQKLSEKREFVWIKRHLSDNELRRFKKGRIMDSDGDLVDGLWLVKESERIYPHGKMASHILGDVNVDSEGLEGVELWKNETMRGKVVSVSAVKDALGRPTFIDAVAAKNVQDGDSIGLTIDASLQFEVEQELANAVHKTGSRSGSVIVMNADNGEILAMANEPSFNPNEKGAPADRRRNRAVTDGYEPGSTLKAVLAASVLSNGGKLTDEVWGERGSFLVQGHKISEAEAKEKFEWVNLKKMMQVSSNVAAAKFALKLGPDRYLKTLHAFGIGTKTGLGFPGEISGKMPAKKDWGALGLANIGFGQGVLVTPLQMTRAYAVILNGGWSVQPTLFKTNPEALKSQERTRVISEKVSSDVIETLSAVTGEGGTGKKAVLEGYQVAGKTGTAQMVDPTTGKYSREKYVASFIGFPLEVEPKIVVFASLSEPRGSYYASETAAPLFREVLSSVANRCNLPILPASEKVLAEHLSDPYRAKDKASAKMKDSLKITQAAAEAVPVDLTLRHPTGDAKSQSRWIVPSLKGLSPREVIGVLKGHHLRLEMVGSGAVSTQIPDAGKTVAEGGLIRLLLSEP